MFSWLGSPIKISMVLTCVAVIRFYVNNKTSFVLSGQEMKQLGEKYAKNVPFEQVFKESAQLIKELRKSYGADRIVREAYPANDFLMSFGGAIVKVQLLYASLTEYLALINAPSTTAGSFGLHWMNQSCTVLSGRFRRFRAGSDSIESFSSGQHARSRMFENFGVSLTNGTWLLCQGRGFAPASAPYVTANTLIQTGDPITVVQFLYAYTAHTAREMYVSLASYFPGGGRKDGGTADA